MSYIDVIKDKARMDKKTIVLPETTDKRTLIAASNIVQEGIADIIMIGNEEKIMDGATWLEIELDGVTIINPHTSEKLDSYVELLYETRKNKGMTPEKAREILLTDNLTFGVIMVKANDADGMVAGACHGRHAAAGPADLKDGPGGKAGIGLLFNVRARLPLRGERYIPVCGLRPESGSHGGGTGCDRGYFRKEF